MTSTRTRTSDYAGASIADFSEWIPIDSTKYVEEEIGKMWDAWSWLSDPPSFPRLFIPRKTRVKYCGFVVKIRYHNAFIGHKFRLGGHKE